MDFRKLIDVVLHLDAYLKDWTAQYGPWIYLLLFLVLYCETGLVVTPFLPGDSLLFAVGALCGAGALNLGIILVLFPIAVFLGDNTNYWIGHYLGPRVFHGEKSRFLNRRHLERTHAFYEKYGGKTIVIARFIPIIRTFAPFVAGVGRMIYARFLGYSVFGCFLWIVIFVGGGYFFGQREIVKKNFSLVIVVIIVLSVLPAVIEFIRHRR